MKRQALACNRCTIFFYATDLGNTLYCEECLSDFNPSEVSNNNRPVQCAAIPRDWDNGIAKLASQSPPIIITDEDEDIDDSEISKQLTCLFCDQDLSLSDDKLKELHVSNCLNSWKAKLSQFDKTPNILINEETEETGLCAKEYFCIICDADISKKGLLNRSFHLKKCAKEHKIATKELLSLLEPLKAESLQSDDEKDDDKDDVQDLTTAVTTQQIDELTVIQPPRKNAWDVLMAGAAKLGNGFTKKADNSTLKTSLSESSIAVERAQPVAMTRTTSYSKRKSWGSSSGSGGFDSEGRPEYVPAYKKIQIPGMSHPIVVDGFQFASKALSDCYFLTHFHSDHYTGLSKTFSYGKQYSKYVNENIKTSRSIKR